MEGHAPIRQTQQAGKFGHTPSQLISSHLYSALLTRLKPNVY